MTIETIAGAATAIGVIVAAVQLYLSRKQQTVQFEDELAREYRQLSQRIPIGALLGDDLPESELTGVLAEFFHYFTLTNDQVFLRQRGRISKKTWLDWKAGISSNLKKPAFSAAWRRISDRELDSFVELRRLETEKFSQDPKRWRS